MRGVSALLAACAAILSTAAQSSDASQWLISQSQLDGALHSDPSIATRHHATFEGLETLLELGVDGPAVTGAFQYLEQVDSDESIPLARRIIVRESAGVSSDTLKDRLLDNQNQDGGFAAARGAESTVWETSLALRALVDRQNTSETSASLQFLLSQQNPDGGWSSGAASPSVFLTAQALQALWLFRHALNLDESIESARGFLLSQRDGDQWDELHLSAVALLALTPTLFDRAAIQGSVLALRGAQQEDGSFQSDVYVTALAARALEAAGQGHEDEVRLFGRIRDDDTQLPLEGVELRLEGPSAQQLTTDRSGRFALERLMPGRYTLSIRANQYDEVIVATALDLGDVVDLGDIDLMRATVEGGNDGDDQSGFGTIRGHATNRLTGEGIAGATIQLNADRRTTTAPDGTFQFASAIAGSVSLAVAADGFEPAAFDAQLLSDQVLFLATELDPILSRPVSVSGLVTDRDTGAVLVNALVRVEHDGGQRFETLTNASGRYQFEDIPLGLITVTVAFDGFGEAVAAARPDSGGHFEFSPSLRAVDNDSQSPEFVTIRGTVFDRDGGQVVSGASISLTSTDPETGARVTENARTTADGQFERTVRAGNIRIRISKFLYLTRQIEMSATGEGQIDLNAIQLELDQSSQPVSVRGTVIDAVTGDPLDGVFVRFPDLGRLVRTNADGTFGVDRGVGPGDHRMEIFGDGYQTQRIGIALGAGQDLDLQTLRLRPLGVDQIRPDLAIVGFGQDLITKDASTLSATGHVDVLLSNVGHADSPNEIEIVAFYDFGLDQQYDAGVDPLYGRINLADGLAVGESTTVNLEVTGELPFVDAPITVAIDPSNQILEVEEFNNVTRTPGACGDGLNVAVDLAICLDTSGSLSTTQLLLQLDGTAAAIEDPSIIPHNGSVRLSVLQFASATVVEVPPTVIGRDNAADVANLVRDIVGQRTGTSIDSCINTATDLLTELVPRGTTQIIDLSTDGISSRDQAIAASNRAAALGIDALNAIGVGRSANIEFLEDLVFPKPAGGNAGFAITAESFSEYAEALAGIIQRQDVQQPDVSIGLLSLVENGAGQPPSLTARLGNAGTTELPDNLLVTFYSGHPDSEGVELGSITVAGVAPGGFVDLRLNEVSGIDPQQRVYAMADSARGVAECDEANNLTSIPVEAAQKLGAISVLPSAQRYVTGQVATFDGVVNNLGQFGADFLVRLRVEDAAGGLVEQFANVEVGQVPGGGDAAYQIDWAVGGILAGNYRAVAELIDRAGNSVARGQSLFSVVHADDQGTPVADVRTSTDRPAYRPDDVVRLEHVVRNLTRNAILEAVVLTVELVGPDGTVLHASADTIGDLSPGAIRQLLADVALDQAGEGRFELRTMVDAGGSPITADVASFTVARELAVDLGAVVQVALDALDAGQAQTCTIAFDNRGDSIDALPVRYLLAELDNGAVVTEQSDAVDIAAGADLQRTVQFETSGLASGDHACVAQAQIDGAWIDLDAAVFRVAAAVAQPIDVRVSLSLDGPPRLLALVAPSAAAASLGDATGCVPHTRIELDGDWRVQQFSPGATLEVNVHDPSGRVVDAESLTLGPSGEASADHNAGSAGVNLRVLRFSGHDVVVALVPTDPAAGFPAPRYQFVATGREGTQLEQLNSGVVFPDCQTQTTDNGTRYQDFLVLEERPGPDDGPQITAQDKADVLHGAVNSLAWSARVVEDVRAFSDALRSGNFNAFALLAGAVPLPERTERELLERVFSGDVLLVAGDAATALDALQPALGVDSVMQLSAASVTAIDEDFDVPQAVALAEGLPVVSGTPSASAAGRVLARFDQPDEPAVAAVVASYGDGFAALLGMDPIEHGLLGDTAGWERALRASLAVIQRSAPAVYAGSLAALEVDVSNASAQSLSGQLVLQLPAASQVVDAGFADQQGPDAWAWWFDLQAADTAVHPFWVRLPVDDGPAEFNLLARVDTAEGSQAQDTERLVVQALAPPTLGDLAALAQSDADLIDVGERLVEADAAEQAGELGGALRLMLDAAELLEGPSRDPDALASDVRRQLTAAIAARTVAVSLDDLSYQTYQPPREPGAGSTLFSFEVDGEWAASNIAVSVDPADATDGAASLAAPLSGYSEIQSRPFAPAEELGDGESLAELLIDVQVPADQTQWVGYLEVVFKMPSAGLYWQRVGGRVDFSGLERGRWHTLRYALDSRTAEALRSAGADAQWILAINGSAGASPYLLDHLRVQ